MSGELSIPAPREASIGVPCHGCEYDVRAQPDDGRCPECGASVAESRRLARIPRRPAWRDSDPRSRRRVLAGAWMLALVPLLSILRAFEWDEHVPIPTFLDVQGGMTLRDSYVGDVYAWLAFCVGVGLLFARERFRQRGRLDWTRRWGIVASYGVLLLGAIPIAFITALVMAGIGALFLAMPLAYQPPGTDAIAVAGQGWLRYGPHGGSTQLDVALPACSTVVVLLALVPLYDALRSCGGRRGWAAVLLAPLAFGSIRQLAYGAMEALQVLPRSFADHPIHPYYFNAELLAQGLAQLGATSIRREFVFELLKWSACAAIAIRLSVAQVTARVRPAPIASA